MTVPKRDRTGRPADGRGWRATVAGPFAVGAALLLTSPAAAQEVNVRYPNPRGYIDASNGAGPDLPLRGTLAEFTGIMQNLGRLYLKPGDRLDVTVLQLDIAGIRTLGYGVAAGPRVVTGATAPQIELAYTLRRGGRVALQATEFITDPQFLATQNPRYSSGRLYYEKRILTDWFEDRFRYGRPPRVVTR